MSLRAWLQDTQRVLVLDGGLATELEALGCDLNDPLWSGKVLLDAPELVARVEESYLRAGCRCLIAATYQVTPQAIVQQRPHMTLADATAAIEGAVRMAHDVKARFLAADAGQQTGVSSDTPPPDSSSSATTTAPSSPQAPAVFVVGSVGPYGAFLPDGAEYRGDYSLPADEMQAFHRPRIAALVRAGVDALAIETQPSAAEVRALLDLLAREFTEVPVWVSFTTAPHAPHTHVCDGTPFADIVPLLNRSAQVIAIGVNCIALRDTTAALQHLRTLTDKPLVAYPNSGEVYDGTHKTWLPPSADDASTLAAQCDEWVRAGARLIGGCCRTRPQDIQELRARLQQLGYTV